MVIIKKIYIYQLILAMTYFFIVLGFWPGFMSFDSFNILNQSMSLNINNWHPPIYTLSWTVLNKISEPPMNMLIFQSFIGYLSFVILLNHYKNFRWAWGILIIPILPWIMNFSGVIWKDVLFSNGLMLVCALWIRGFHKVSNLLVIILLTYILNLRWNGLFAISVFMFLLLLEHFYNVNRIKLVILWAFATSMISIVPNYIITEIFDVKNLQPSNAIFVDDLFRISAINHNYYLLPLTNETMITNCENVQIGESTRIGKIMCLENESKNFSYYIKSNSLFKIWISNIIENPIIYLENRLQVFQYNLRIDPQTPYYVWHPGIIENKLGYELRPNPYRETLDKYVNSTIRLVPILFLPFVWISINILCLLILKFNVKYIPIKKKFSPVLLSSLFYSFSFVILGGSADYRYYYYLSMSTSVVLILILIERFNQKRILA